VLTHDRVGKLSLKLPILAPFFHREVVNLKTNILHSALLAVLRIWTIFADHSDPNPIQGPEDTFL
jgi:hypothetical protein